MCNSCSWILADFFPYFAHSSFFLPSLFVFFILHFCSRTYFCCVLGDFPVVYRKRFIFIVMADGQRFMRLQYRFLYDFTNNHIDIIRKGNAYFMTKFIKSDFLWIPFLIYVWEQGAKLTGQIKLWFISLQNPSSTGWTRILRKLHAKHTRLVDGYKCIYVYTDVYII